MQTEHSIPDYVNVVKTGIVKNFQGERRKKVIIVGAGLAGLSAAYELLEAGRSEERRCQVSFRSRWSL
jgi:ribulose 1,5-bisphosphate synthetase/thiazole synthase